jgi:hypothetical protein
MARLVAHRVYLAAAAGGLAPAVVAAQVGQAAAAAVFTRELPFQEQPTRAAAAAGRQQQVPRLVVRELWQ